MQVTSIFSFLHNVIKKTSFSWSGLCDKAPNAFLNSTLSSNEGYYYCATWHESLSFKNMLSPSFHRLRVQCYERPPSALQFNPFLKWQILNSSKRKSLQMTISSLVKMAGSFPIGQKTLVGKGEIARYEQFLLFPKHFQKTFTADRRKNLGLCRKGLDTISNKCDRENSLYSLAMLYAFPRGVLGSNPTRSLYFCHAFVHLFLCYGLCS